MGHEKAIQGLIRAGAADTYGRELEDGTMSLDTAYLNIEQSVADNHADAHRDMGTTHDDRTDFIYEHCPDYCPMHFDFAPCKYQDTP